MGLRKAWVALMRAISPESGAMNLAPAALAASVVNPGQPMPAPHNAATRPSSTIAGPSPAWSR